MSILDKILLQFRRLASLSALFGGEGAHQNRQLNKCDWCHQSTSARKADNS